MKVISPIALLAVAGFANLANAAVYSLLGCYTSSSDMVMRNESNFQSSGLCYTKCVQEPKAANKNSFAVMALTRRNFCYCGNLLPNAAYKVDNDKCNVPCGGYTEMCGGSGRYGDYYSVYNTNEEPNVETEPAPESSTSSASKTSTASDSSSTTSGALTTNNTAKETNTPSNSVNKAGVAAGAVVGVLAIIALGVGVFFFMRKRRRQEVEEEYRRSAAVRGFVQKPALDNRLDPVMVQRRDSVGSIADNQDYSRKILRVTNPDG